MVDSNNKEASTPVLEKLQFRGKDVTIEAMRAMIFHSLEKNRLKPLSANKLKKRVRKGKSKEAMKTDNSLEAMR